MLFSIYVLLVLELQTGKARESLGIGSIVWQISYM